MTAITSMGGDSTAADMDMRTATPLVRAMATEAEIGTGIAVLMVGNVASGLKVDFTGAVTMAEADFMVVVLIEQAARAAS
jgi:hypothetical protein